MITMLIGLIQKIFNKSNFFINENNYFDEIKTLNTIAIPRR